MRPQPYTRNQVVVSFPGFQLCAACSTAALSGTVLGLDGALTISEAGEGLTLFVSRDGDGS